MSHRLLHLDLSEVASHFASWRQTRNHSHSRIPENLWQEALSLCQNHPISHVCRQLRLNPQALSKKRRESSKRVAFVEVVKPLEPPAVFPSIEMELIRPDGAKLLVKPSSSEGMALVMDHFLGD